MEIVNTAINAGVVAAVGLTLAWLAKGRFQALERQISAVDMRMDGPERRLDAMQASIDALRSDVTRVALAVGARPQAENA
jgi:hypothetical protein